MTSPQSNTEERLKPCPFCGGNPIFWDVCGTQARLECEDCGQASVNIQVSDLFDYDDARRHAEIKPPRYENRPDIVKIVNKELSDRWNTRHD